MELDELIENTLRRKHLEEMLSRPEREHTPLEGMDADQIKRFALFLYEENQNKLEKPNKFDPFGQTKSAHLIYHTIAPLKVLVMGVNFILPF